MVHAQDFFLVYCWDENLVWLVPFRSVWVWELVCYHLHDKVIDHSAGVL